MRKEIGKLTAMLLTVCVCSQPCILPVWAAEGDGGHPETEAVSETVSEKMCIRDSLSAGPGLYGRASGLLRSDLKQYGFRVRP